MAISNQSQKNFYSWIKLTAYCVHDYRIKAGKENNLHLIIVHHTRHISYNANKESKMESISDSVDSMTETSRMESSDV